MFLALLREILSEMKKGNTLLMTIDESIKAFSDKANAALDQANQSLDNIVADEANLNKQIQDLKALLGNETLSPEAQAALDKVATASEALAAKSKSLADAVPDSVEPPVTPTP